MSIVRRIANLFRCSRMDRKIDAELQSHIALRADDNLAAGMAPEEVRPDALLRFGNPAATRERVTAVDASRASATCGAISALRCVSWA